MAVDSTGDGGEVNATVEQINGKGWIAFRDRYGDSGRELVLYAGQRLCGRKLAAATGTEDYGAVSSAIKRFERLLRHGEVGQQQWRQLCQKYKNQMTPGWHGIRRLIKFELGFLPTEPRGSAVALL